MKKLFLVFLLLFVSVNLLRCTGSLNQQYITPSSQESSSNDSKLTISVTGVGDGRVISPENGIYCSKKTGSCTKFIKKGEVVTLTAEPENGYVFLGWYGGACQGGPDCQVTLDQAKEVKAAFGMIAYISNLDPSKTDHSPFNSSENQAFNIWIAKTDGKSAYPLTQAMKANSQFPRWSPDGTKLLYQSSRALDGSDQDIGRYNIWVINADGSDPKPLTQMTKADSTLPQWSPDGTQIVYASFRALDGTDNKNDVSNLWLMNADGSKNRALTQLTKAGNYEPQWSPDGKQIAYESSRALDGNDQNNGHYNIWMVTIDNLKHQAITQSKSADSYLPQWSPNGEKIAYQSFQALNGNDERNLFSNIWIANVDSLKTQPLTQLTKAGSYSVQWSADGTHLVYESSRALDGSDQHQGHYNIWVTNPDGSQNKPLTQLTNADSYLPQRLASGDQIVYGSSRSLDGTDGNNNNLSNIWVMNLEQAETKPLTQSSNAHSFLQFIAE